MNQVYHFFLALTLKATILRCIISKESLEMNTVTTVKKQRSFLLNLIILVLDVPFKAIQNVLLKPLKKL